MDTSLIDKELNQLAAALDDRFRETAPHLVVAVFQQGGVETRTISGLVVSSPNESDEVVAKRIRFIAAALESVGYTLRPRSGKAETVFAGSGHFLSAHQKIVACQRFASV